MPGEYLKRELYARVRDNPEIFEFIQSGSLDGVWYWDLENPDYEWMSEKFWQVLGYNPQEKYHLASEWQDIIFKEDLALAMENFEKHCADPDYPYDQLVRYRHKDGSTVWIQCRGLVIRNEMGKPVRMIGAHTNVTTLREEEREKHREASLRSELQLILNSVTDGIYKVNLHGLVTHVNPAALALLGFRENELLGQAFYHVVQTENANGETCQYKQSRVYQTLTGAGPSISKDERYRTKEGKWLNIEYKANALLSEDGLVQGAVVVFRDITLELEATLKLKKLAYYDLMTKLPNRKHCYDYLERLLGKASRRKTKIALLFIDLDDFKDINDLHGHEMGDNLLIGITEKLQNNLRQSDFIARLGGDEFVVIIEDYSCEQTLNGFVKHLLSVVAEPLNLGEIVASVTCSIGIALYPNNGSNAQELLRFADQAMYQSKQYGRNRYTWFSVEINRRFVRENLLRRELKKAIDNDQLYLRFQAIWNSQHKLVGFEALCRWTFAGEKISPEEFIPIAERSELIGPLGHQVLDKALNALFKWRADYKFKGYISVNVSLSQLCHDEFVLHVRDRLKELNIPSSKLLLEITESKLVERFEQYEASLNAFSEMGLSLALDDFGTGYASFRHLHLMPVRYLKIDRSFLYSMPEKPEATSTVTSLLDLGRSLKLELIVEGVERKEQSRWLDKFDCCQQGFWHARPGTARSCEKLLAAANEPEPFGAG